jgi:hypothetical protein
MAELRDTILKLTMVREGHVPPVSGDIPSQAPPIPVPHGFEEIQLLAPPPGLHPRYAGWRLKKRNAGRTENGRWRSSAAAPLLFSSEELFLQVANQIADNGRKGRTLQDVYDRLESQSERNVIDRLITRQNKILQQHEPLLEWKLAGLRSQMRSLNWYLKETTMLFVILKTEIRLQKHADPLPHRQSNPRFGRSALPVTPGSGPPHKTDQSVDNAPRYSPRSRRESFTEASESSRETGSPNRQHRKTHQQRSISPLPFGTLVTSDSRREGVLVSTNMHNRKDRGSEYRQDITVQEEDELIDSHLADWDEVLRFWPLRRHLHTLFISRSRQGRQEYQTDSNRPVADHERSVPGHDSARPVRQFHIHSPNTPRPQLHNWVRRIRRDITPERSSRSRSRLIQSTKFSF